MGDCFLTIGMFAILWSLGNVDYSTVFSLAPFVNENMVTIIGICLLIGAMAKSSQVGQVKALKNLWVISGFFWILIYAGKISNALESGASVKSFVSYSLIWQTTMRLKSKKSFILINKKGLRFYGTSGINAKVNSFNLCSHNNVFKLKQVSTQSLEQFQRQGINQQELNKLINNKILDIKFLEWFIGFTEGDGSFVVTGGKSVFSIHLHMVDLPLLYYIQNQLNMGNVYLGNNSATFIVKAKADINILIHIFNGNLFLRKRQDQFFKWVENFNNLVLAKDNTTIVIKQGGRCEFKPSLNDNWLAGFIDAEGSFFCSVSKIRIYQKFAIGQKDAELEFLYLNTLINGYYSVEKSKNFYRIVLSYRELDTIINYLSKHKLYSVKAQSFEKWLEIYEYRKNKPSNVVPDYKEMKKKASLINQLRKIPLNFSCANNKS